MRALTLGRCVLQVLSASGATSEKDLKVTRLFYLQGLNRVDVERSYSGEIISLAGTTSGGVTDTVCSPLVDAPVPSLPISPPVISMTFGPNTSPLAGKDGTRLTSSMIKDRLNREIENNVTISLRKSADIESVDVQGRGELQIGILVETMRREGFELTVSPPRVLAVVGEDGVRREPFEEVTVDVDPEFQGLVIENMTNRSGVMVEFKDIGNRARLVFQTPSRGMMGFRQEVMSATRGNALVNSCFSHYEHVDLTAFSGLRKGKLVSTEQGKTRGYALDMVEERGSLFVGVGEEVYEGMVIGETAKPGDLDVNPCKGKKLTNVRASGTDDAIRLTPPRLLTLEQALEFIDEDELVEVTPASIRLRKKELDPNRRKRGSKG